MSEWIRKILCRLGLHMYGPWIIRRSSDWDDRTCKRCGNKQFKEGIAGHPGCVNDPRGI